MLPLVFVPPPSFWAAVYCFICGRRRVAVARYRMICLVLIPRTNFYLQLLGQQIQLCWANIGPTYACWLERGIEGLQHVLEKFYALFFSNIVNVLGLLSLPCLLNSWHSVLHPCHLLNFPLSKRVRVCMSSLYPVYETYVLKSIVPLECLYPFSVIVLFICLGFLLSWGWSCKTYLTFKL